VHRTRLSRRELINYLLLIAILAGGSTFFQTQQSDLHHAQVLLGQNNDKLNATQKRINQLVEQLKSTQQTDESRNLDNCLGLNKTIAKVNVYVDTQIKILTTRNDLDPFTKQQYLQTYESFRIAPQICR
jgi:Zn-dependent metalloprotease